MYLPIQVPALSNQYWKLPMISDFSKNLIYWLIKYHCISRTNECIVWCAVKNICICLCTFPDVWLAVYDVWNFLKFWFLHKSIMLRAKFLLSVVCLPQIFFSIQISSELSIKFFFSPLLCLFQFSQFQGWSIDCIIKRPYSWKACWFESLALHFQPKLSQSKFENQYHYP